MTRFVAGWNMPGYLPEMEPAVFDHLGDAIAFLIDEINRIADEAWDSREFVHHCDEVIYELEGATDLEGSVELHDKNLVFWWQVEE